MRNILIGTLLAMMAWPVFAGDLAVPARIEKAMLGEHRSESNRDRNRYRHPVGTLTFFGLADGMTVMEITPGGGWYTEVLAPAIRHHGQFIVAGYDIDVEGQPEYRYAQHDAMIEMFESSPELYDQVAMVPFSPPESSNLGDAESVDMVLTFRNLHGWMGSGIAESIFQEFARVLKPGGVLGVVQHRAPAGSDPEETGPDGYIPEQAVIDLARAAGLYLEARSEVNANPKDDHDHEFGVWTLPPSLRACRDLEDTPEWAACAEPWQAIGESDRMTLKFRKPAG
ncbi:MAG: methyltransferase domain-containing protein [Xanthomonadales bacterium]|nr:methyltransferase domain-containing protein [Xanthomonadales bacterium]